MALITEEYRKLNYDKHASSTGYGTSGKYYADEILRLSKKLGTQDILDYGCGKSTLAQCLPFSINQYDPAVKKYQGDPAPADLVVCTDVLEHIEPECLDDVLTHLHSKTKKVLYASISVVEAFKHLADGRNAHLIVEEMPFWVAKLHLYFLILSIFRNETDLIVIAERRELEEKKDD